MNTAVSERDPFDAVAEDFLSRWRAGAAPSVNEYVERYPELAEQIRELFPALVLMEKHRPGDPGAASELWQDGPVPKELGEYRLLGEIGRGGMGVVYEAVQMSLDRHVALKVLPPHRMRGQEHLERFRREARIAAGLHHTNIVPVFGVGEHEGTHYYAMQFIRGHGLDQVLREVTWLRKQRGEDTTPHTHTDRAATIAASMINGQFADPDALADFSMDDPGVRRQGSGVRGQGSEVGVRGQGSGVSNDDQTSASDGGLTTSSHWHYSRSVAQIGLQVADALDYAHRQGILHRDIKPSNLLLDLAGRVWITDFGLAKAEDSDNLTEADQLLGTIRYMAPERFEGKVEQASDIFSLGTTLYEMLTLRPAFEGVHRAEVMERILHGEPLPPRKVDGRIPRDLETIVRKAMAKEPAHRYPSAEKMAADLRSFLSDRPIQARRPSSGEQIVRWCRRNPAVAALSTALALALLVFTVKALIDNAQLTAALGNSESANKESHVRLWESLHDRARAMRMSRHAGQRLEALRSIAEAMRLPLPPGHTLDELRTEAVAALALPDIEVEREWLGGLTPGIVGLAFDGILEKYATLAQDGTITVRNIQDDREIASWKEGSSGPWEFHERGLLFSQDGRYLSIWHRATNGLIVRRLEGSESTVCYHAENAIEDVDFSLDGKRLAYLTVDKRIVVVELPSGQVHYLPPPVGVSANHVQLGADDRFAVTVNRHGKHGVEIRDLATGSLERTLPHPAPAYAVPLQGNTWATRGDDEHKIRLWDARSGTLTHILEGHKTKGIYCDFDSTGRLLLSNDWNCVLRVWEVSSARPLLSLPAGGYHVLRISADGRLPALKSADLTRIQMLRLHANPAYQTIGTGTCLELAVHPRGRLLACSFDPQLAIIDLATGRPVAQLPITDCRGFAWESANALLTGNRSGLLHWPLQRSSSGDLHPPLASPSYRLGPPQRLLSNTPRDTWGFSADRMTIAMPNHYQGATVLHRGPPQRTVRLQPQQDVRHCAVSPDGRWVATGSHDCSDGTAAKVWEAATGKLLKALPVPQRCSVDFSPDGRWLLTTGGGCRLWQVDTWSEGPVIGGAEGCFSPDSSLVAAEDSAGAIRLVSTETRKLVVRLESPEQSRLIPRSFTPDGTRLIACGVDTEALHIWDLREVRRGLAELGLDWDEPAYPPLGSQEETERLGTIRPLQVAVDPGDLKVDSPKTIKEALEVNNQAWLLATNPEPKLRDPKKAIELALHAIELVPKQGTYWNTLGVAHYRAGHWNESIKALTKSMELSAGKWESFNTFFLAMAHWQQGDREKAQEYYKQAVLWFEKNKELIANQEGWLEELTRFGAEAAKLLRVEKKSGQASLP